MTDVNKLLDDLRLEISGLESRFISKWLPADPAVEPEAFEHEVKAFCVLSHAAFEEFAESLSLIVMKSVESAWLNQKFSKASIAILLSYPSKLNIPEKELTKQDRVFDQVRGLIDKCVTAHSATLSNNHGFSLKYLRNILTPVAIDVPEDNVPLMASLKDLTEARGSYAHSIAKKAHFGQWQRAGRPMVPENARNIVADCLALCSELASRAKLLI